MTTSLKCSEDIIKNPVPSDHLQFLPCSIDFTGSTEVTDRFSKFTETKSDGTLTNSLRGFPLEGKVLSVPEGYTGLVVESGKSGLTEKDKQARVTASFEKYQFWNYDRTPSEGDSWQQAVQWTKVAEILHSD